VAVFVNGEEKESELKPEKGHGYSFGTGVSSGYGALFSHCLMGHKNKQSSN
jgi:hypothetical protein